MSKSAIEVKKTHTPAETQRDPWQSFRQEMNRLMNQFDMGFRWPSLGRVFDVSPISAGGASFEFNAPLVDVAEDDKSYTLTAELPGLEQKDIEVTLSNHRLTLKGEKRQEKEEKDKSYYLSERCYGSFERSFTLPDEIDAEKLSATFSKGVLTITLPKTAEAQKQKKTIEVKAA